MVFMDLLEEDAPPPASVRGNPRIVHRFPRGQKQIRRRARRLYVDAAIRDDASFRRLG
jgi:hypothetical protein